MTPYIYVVVNINLPLSQQIVQSCHACHHAGNLYGAPPDCHLVLLQGTEEVLQEVEFELTKSNIEFVLYEDPDIHINPTALATQRVYKKILRKYKLWKHV